MWQYIRRLVSNMRYSKYLYILGLPIILIGLILGMVYQIWFPIPIYLVILGLVMISIWLLIYLPIRYLYILGLLIILIGLILKIVYQVSPPIPNYLIAIGLVMIGIWLLARLPITEKFWQKRSTKVSTKAIVTTSIFIGILVCINFLVVRYEVRIDLTENQLFTLSPQSQAVLKNLEKPVKIWVFEAQPNPADQALLANYSRENPKLSFEFVNPQMQPQLANQFKISASGEVYIEYENQRKLVQQVSQEERLLEAKLTTAIANIDRLPPNFTVYFITGHGEPELTEVAGGLSEAVNGLQNLGYQVKTLNLAKVSKIPEDARGLILVSPKKKLIPGESKALGDYLQKQGRLLLMLEPNTDPGLEELLKDWGIQLDERLVIDVSNTNSLVGFGPATVIITKYGSHPITDAFGNEMSIYHLARPISTKQLPDVQAVALLITEEQTWAETQLEEEEIEFNEEEDIPGPIDIGVALTRDNSRLVIFGNANFATNGWFSQQINSDVFLNTVSWLIGDEEAILSISPKQPENRRINLTLIQTGIIGWLALVIIPISGFLVAIVTWWRRR